ncbi:MAG: glycosyltransferase family 2 protein [Nostoc sp. C3-bin3]|nr:glycosyltransferase family 2 protein [Nostoc sp. C3-bin3]
MKIGIIIPVHNRKVCVQSILTQLYDQAIQGSYLKNIFFIVVDDGSTDGTKELIEISFPTVHLLEGDGSLWWTGGIVKGMEYATVNINTDYVVWMNDDISIADDLISNLFSLCGSSKYRETIIGGIVRDKTYSDWIVYSGLRAGKPIRNINEFSSSAELEVDTLAGNIVVIPRAVIDQVGMPDATKFPHHGGDYEFIRLAKKNGFKVISSSKLQAITDYRVTDFIRYMPYWMQWYLQPSKSQRREIIKGLKDIKSNQNIWLFVNIANRNYQYIPKWKYTLCYLNKLLKLFIIDLMPRRFVESKIYDYFASWSIPSPIAEAAIRQISSR